LAFGPPAQALAQEQRVYVRRIEFAGVSRINDEVLRRELLQLESAYLNTVALGRSLDRLEQLPYVASVAASLRPVDGDLELVDIEIRVVEAPARRYGIGGAYSGALRARAHGYFLNENLFGTGQRLEMRAEGNELSFSSEILHTDPYARLDGVSRTIGVSARRIDRLTVDSSSLDADLDSARLEYGYRIGPAAVAGAPVTLDPTSSSRFGTRLAFGVELSRAEIAAGEAASAQLRRFVAAVDGTAGAVSRAAFTEAAFLLRWRTDTRSGGSFPEAGKEQVLDLRAALPASDIRYYRIDYGATRYFPLTSSWTAALTTRLGFGAAYDDGLPGLPPYRNWLAGGPATVRGYRDGSLGPRDSLGRPYGGDLLVAAQLEWLTPWPRRWQERVRTGFFYDIGNVFATDDVEFTDELGAPLDYGFGFGELRQSVGLVVRVRIPAGVLSASYAVPLDARRNSPSAFRRDDVERLQLTLGIDF
jgi:outer membrane protein insertion porin family